MTTLLLEASFDGDLYEAAEHVRGAVLGLGSVLEERAFSGLLVSFRIELAPGAARPWRDAMERANVRLDAPSRDALAAAPDDEACDVFLGVRLPHGDPDKRNVVPSVPG